jgi:hypothetical protein
MPAAPRHPLQTLHRRQDAYTSRLRELLASTGSANPINPSMRLVGSDLFVAFRALGPGGPPFRALLVVDRAGAGREVVDLTDHAAALGVPVVADPKLVELGGRVHVTFNTGYDRVRNELYLMEVSPRLGPPRRCEYAGRTAVEKNWAFFEAGGRLRALYGLRPLVVLDATDDDDGAALRFVPHATPAASNPAPRHRRRRELTIGTQVVPRGDDLLLVAHEKVHARGRRGYLGRAVTVRDPLGPTAQVRVSPVRLVHSLAATLRRPAVRHNPNLLFATYFSGLQVDGDDAYLGYGVNDLDHSFAHVGVPATWP